MPRILLKKAKLIQPGNVSGTTQNDICIEDGIIRSIGNIGQENFDHIISSDDLHVSTGFIDLRTHFTAPGTEHITSLAQLSDTAMKGGFTRVCLWGNKEIIHNTREQVHFLQDVSGKHGVEWKIIGALTKDHQGKIPNEWHRMFLAGAAGFSNGNSGTEPLAMLGIAMRYLCDFSGNLFLQCFNDPLQGNHFMYEFPDSLQKGIKGVPLYAETATLASLLQVLAYEHQNAHLSALSLPQSIELLQGVSPEKITCDVPVMSLFYAQEEASLSQPLWKVFPPLADKNHLHGLIQAVASGRVSGICSMHTPLMPEEKQVEWQLSAAGAETLPCTFAMANTALGSHMHTEAIVSLFTTGPAQALGMELPQISEGIPANLCAFDPGKTTRVFPGTVMEREGKGKILACISGTHFQHNHD